MRPRAHPREAMRSPSRRIALVTGTSSGIGQATALELARRGWRVWAGVRSSEAAQDLEHRLDLVGLPRQGVRPVDLDVTDPEQIDRAMSRLLMEEKRGPDAVIANAGFGAAGVVEELELDTWKRVIDTNLMGAILTVRATLSSMRDLGGGHVILISSNAANIPHPTFSPYAATKWGLEGLGEALSLELAPFGIAVTLVQPGAIRTGFADRTISDLRERSPYGPLVEGLTRGWTRLAGGASGPEPVAEAIARALDKRRPPLRLRVGKDARLAAAARRWLPDRLRLELTRRFLGVPGWDSLVRR